VTDSDRVAFAGNARPSGPGRYPVLLVVDANHHFLGPDPRDGLVDANEHWPDACGSDGWGAVAHLSRLLPEAREQGVPVIYFTGRTRARRRRFVGRRWRDREGWTGTVANRVAQGNEIASQIAPQPDDFVLTKRMPSAFFETFLPAFLADLQADTLLVTGLTTSGSVRATVSDGLSLNFRVSVVSECTADRDQASYARSLLEMRQEHADVLRIEDTVSYLRSIPRGLFDLQMAALRRTRDARRLARLRAAGTL
jgi:maleamate amidohydrolase